jgi:hypothetical protein
MYSVWCYEGKDASMTDIKLWFPTLPRPVKLVEINCRPDKDGVFMHRAYEGRKIVASVRLNGILCDDTLEHLRTDPVRTVALWKISWEPHVF